MVERAAFNRSVQSSILCLSKHYFYFSHYISTPQLAYDMMLKSTGVEIELLTDIDKIIFIEQNIKGGMSYINQRFCNAGPTLNKKSGVIFHGEIIYMDGKENRKLTFLNIIAL